MLPPERAVWPLPPRPLVLPWPPPSPQPTRFFRCTAPGTFFNSWSLILVPVEAPRAAQRQRTTRIFLLYDLQTSVRRRVQLVARTFAMFSARRSWRSPLSVACTTAMWFEEPIDFVRIFLIPAASR